MTGHGGWPLNCFALPDGRPIYGGTYFPKQQWKNILLNLADLYKNETQKALDYAAQLTEGVRLAELVKVNESKEDFSADTLYHCYENWKPRFDTIEGGPNKAPKFPLPNNYQFLLRYANYSDADNELLLEHIDLTLKKMAYGGIYDQIGGGFARYSVDHLWKVPHFEKMLYDNAQLVTLYCEAFQATNNPLYKQIVYETLAFVERELTSPEGAFYSALDADSEGVEGKYYVWTKKELEQILENDFAVFADYFNVNETGFWEHENYILLRHDDDERIADKHSISVNTLKEIIEKCKRTLLAVREKRIRPGLDDKTLTSWNALMLKGFVDASNVFDDAAFLEVAVRNADFILQKMLVDESKLYHAYKNGKATINGFLEDYCFTIEAFIALYQACFDEKYLTYANKLMSYCIQHFQEQESGMFYFTSDEDKALITRKMELSDNVIPSSNSSIAKSLFMLGHYMENENYISMSRKMLNNVLSEIESYGPGYSNWAMLLLHFISPFYEVAIVGKAVDEKYKSFQKHYLPNVIFAGSSSESALPLLKNRFTENETFIYVCENKTCFKPVSEVDEALKQIFK
jgi:uncharacterized protein YyaL (SSP411 family)